MAEGGFYMQNQLKFNLDVPLSAANIALRYHKPKAIIIERAGGVTDHPHPVSQGPVSRSPGQSSLNLSNISEDRLALAVQLAKRDVKRRKEQNGSPSRTPSPKGSGKPRRPLVSKGGTKIIHTKECRDRAQRLQERRGRDPLKVREQGWNSGTSMAQTQTPPRDRRQNLPVTTNSPPTRDTDNYPVQRSAPLDNPVQEIGRLQKEIEGYLQQIQVIEQRAMRDQPLEAVQPKSRKKDGYLSDEEDPARRALRQEEQATRAARQIYFLRQQVRSLQEVVTRKGTSSVKHTKKSQVMLRLAAAHRGAVRAIQSFVNQQLPQQDLRRGLPTGYHELALLIRQLALVSTQIKADKDTTEVHEDLIKMLDRVDDLNKAWCSELEDKTETAPGNSEGERRRKSPTGRQPDSRAQTQRGRQLQPRRTGKENRPKDNLNRQKFLDRSLKSLNAKTVHTGPCLENSTFKFDQICIKLAGLLKKQYNKQTKSRQQEPRKLTPERQNILRAGLESLVREDPSLHQRPSGMTWNVPMETSVVSEPANASLILPKHIQHKREKAQRSVPLAVPETHFTDPTVSFNLKTVHLDESVSSPSREPWRPGGSLHSSATRQPRSKSAERTRSLSRSRSQDRSRSKSPRSRSGRHVVISDVDQELISELFPQRQHKQPPRPRSASPGSPGRQRARSPPMFRSGRDFAHSARGRLQHLNRGAKDVSMARERQREAAEISIRERLAERGLEKAEVNGEILSDMILHDLLRDTAEELESLEEEESARRDAVTMHHSPTLENMYQRLEQMELEQNDIRRRWSTLHFHEETSRRTASLPERPSAPVAMEITRQTSSQSHRVQSSRAYSRETAEPIVFTKSAPVPKFQKKMTPLVNSDDDSHDDVQPALRGPARIRLKISETVVRDIKNNLEKYEGHLRKTQHEREGRFDPWRLVEEIADQVLEECLREVDTELDEIGEGIIHQVCRSEFSVPDPSVVAEQLAVERILADRLQDRIESDRIDQDRMEHDKIDRDRIGHDRSELARSGRDRTEEDRRENDRAEIIRTVEGRTELDISDLVGTDSDRAKQVKIQPAEGSREFSLDRLGRIQEEHEQNISDFGVNYEKDIDETPRGEFESENDEDVSPRVERFESLGDIEDLQPVDSETEIQTERDSEHVARSIDYDQSRSEVRQIESHSGVRQNESFSQSEARGSMTQGVARVDSYEEDYEEEEEEDDDDVEEVSPIDTDDLEYSTDET